MFAPRRDMTQPELNQAMCATPTKVLLMAMHLHRTQSWTRCHHHRNISSIFSQLSLMKVKHSVVSTIASSSLEMIQQIFQALPTIMSVIKIQFNFSTQSTLQKTCMSLKQITQSWSIFLEPKKKGLVYYPNIPKKNLRPWNDYSLFFVFRFRGT